MSHDRLPDQALRDNANGQYRSALSIDQNMRQGVESVAFCSTVERPDQQQSHPPSSGYGAQGLNRPYSTPYSNPYAISAAAPQQIGNPSQQYKNEQSHHPLHGNQTHHQQHQSQSQHHYSYQTYQYQNQNPYQYQEQPQKSLQAERQPQQQFQVQTQYPANYSQNPYSNDSSINQQAHKQTTHTPFPTDQRQQQQSLNPYMPIPSNIPPAPTHDRNIEQHDPVKQSALASEPQVRLLNDHSPVHDCSDLPDPSPIEQERIEDSTNRGQQITGLMDSVSAAVNGHSSSDVRSSLPHDVADMIWNEERTLNDRHKYCYCGDDRNLLDVDVQCQKCLNFFHGRCIKLSMGPVVPFMTNYHFTCKICSPGGQEVFSRLSCTWKSVCATVLANLILMRVRILNQHWEKSAYAAKNRSELFRHSSWFTRKNDLLPFLEVPRHWAAICTDRSKSETTSWASSLATALINHPDIFTAQDETNRTANSGYTLKHPDLFAFKAGYLNNFKSSAIRKRKVDEVDHKHQSVSSPVLAQRTGEAYNGLATNTDMTKSGKPDIHIPPERVSQRERPVVKQEDAPAFTAKIPTIKKEPARPANVATKDLARERKPTAKKAATVKKNEPSPAKLIRRPPPYKPEDFNARPKPPGMTQVEGPFPEGPYYSITDIPYNKRGFKYTPCEAAPTMPAIMYRTVEVDPHDARLDWSDMSPYMYLSKDGRSATTDKGFRMGRANVGVRNGDWYWEVKVLRGNGDHGGHVRLGVARREASLDGPIGFDGYSYGIRDKGGEKMHLSRPRAFMESFGTGDVIGFHLSLPKTPATEVVRDRIPIRYRQQLYFEQYEYTTSKEMEDLLNPGIQISKSSMPPCLTGSFLNVYKNGKLMGTAFEDLFSYWPPNSQTQKDQPAQDDGQMGYFPAVSVYSGGAVRLNFGPNFENPPETNILKDGLVRCMSERYDEQIAEEVVYDLIDEIEFGEDLKELSLGQQLEVEPIREIAEYD